VALLAPVIEELVTDADETLGEGAPSAVTPAYDAGSNSVQIATARSGNDEDGLAVKVTVGPA
jgi:hypothetical protein